VDLGDGVEAGGVEHRESAAVGVGVVDEAEEHAVVFGGGGGGGGGGVSLAVSLAGTNTNSPPWARGSRLRRLVVPVFRSWRVMASPAMLPQPAARPTL